MKRERREGGGCIGEYISGLELVGRMDLEMKLCGYEHLSPGGADDGRSYAPTHEI